MTALAVALVGAYGVFLVWSALAFGWTGLAPGPAKGRGEGPRRPPRPAVSARLGLPGTSLAELTVACGVLFALGAAVSWVVFGGVVVPALVGVAAAAVPVAAARRRHAARMERARDGWPQLIEEIRLQTGSLGRSLPQALIAVGRRAPDELRAAFAAAEREWWLSTDFAGTLAVLKAELADPTADVIAETLLVAHRVGGSDIDGRLAALAEDRVRDLQGRRDARAKQAGARFARRFVVGVPVGMALAGLTIGDGRAAFATAAGQAAVVVAVVMIAACWYWAGRIMRLPQPQRVFAEDRLVAR